MCQSGKIIWMIVVLIGGSLLMAAGEEKEAVSAAALVFAAEHEGGCLYRAGEVRVLELQGNYRQMGRQYGHLLGAEMVSLYQSAIEEYYIQEMGLSPERIDDVAQAVFFRYPRRYREILLGMAESSGLSEQHVIRLNALEWIPKIYALSYGHCSGVAAWGPYTSGRPLVFGRNNDDGEYFKQFAVPLVIAVFKPADGSIPVALVNYVGVIYAATGMNAEGLFAELNAGPWVGFSLERKSIFTSLFTFLQDCANLDELTLAMLATLPELNTIINAADRRSACSFEPLPQHGLAARQLRPAVEARHHLQAVREPPPPGAKVLWTVLPGDDDAGAGHHHRKRRSHRRDRYHLPSGRRAGPVGVVGENAWHPGLDQGSPRPPDGQGMNAPVW